MIRLFLITLSHAYFLCKENHKNYDTDLLLDIITLITQ